MQSIDIFRLLGKWCHQITIEHKNQLKTSLSQDCRNICDQDHSNSKLLFGDVLTENVRTAKAIYLTNIETKQMMKAGSSLDMTLTLKGCDRHK